MIWLKPPSLNLVFQLEFEFLNERSLRKTIKMNVILDVFIDFALQEVQQ